MRCVLGKVRSAVGRFARDEGGSATMEFAVVLPFFVIIVFMFAEVGVLAGRTILMKRGVSIAIRDVQLGLNPTADINQFRDSVCRNAFLINSCQQDLFIEMKRIDVTQQASLGDVACVNRVDPSLSPVVTFNKGGTGDIMLVRACLVVDPVFPGTGLAVTLARDASGGYAIVSQTAFMNEPK